ncbi:MAG TPA: TetR/AcrR family transcriptional regulator [Flavipsychrobacter sp.]|nr:TetR/AcrR family transcriptional regulator [Flavipsychrobacter sp.]
MDTLTKILSAAIELFRQYGFKTITMDDVARKAGISKKTLYQHFANKNEVVTESILWFKNNISDSCNAHLEHSENPVEGMVRVMAMFDDINRKMNPLVLFEMERFFPECFKRFRESIVGDDVELLKGNLKAGIEQGYYREDINVDFLALYRMELSLLIYNPNLLVNDTHHLHEVNTEVSEHFLYGIMTAKGEKLYKKYKEKYLKQVSNI